MKKVVKKEMPLGVKILSILGYMAAALMLLLAILMFVGSAGSLVSNVPGLALLGTSLFVVGGIILLALAALEFFIARGLWKGQNWARIVVLIFTGLSILGGVVGMAGGEIGSNIVSLVINLLIGWYLLFKANVKAYFA